jgi:mRNA-degrading endonuclease RelE of RelBE toxin-antitoxin system
MYRVQIAPAAAHAFRQLHPQIRKQLKAGMRELSENPYSGKMLQNELAGFLTYRIRRHRIIYRIEEAEKVLKVFMIGHRAEIYDLLSLLMNKG